MSRKAAEKGTLQVITFAEAIFAAYFWLAIHASMRSLSTSKSLDLGAKSHEIRPFFRGI
jgi:hypothetical protein